MGRLWGPRKRASRPGRQAQRQRQPGIVLEDRETVPLQQFLECLAEGPVFSKAVSLERLKACSEKRVSAGKGF